MIPFDPETVNKN